VGTNELKTGGKANITGGFGIESGASNGATGFGTITGTNDKGHQCCDADSEGLDHAIVEQHKDAANRRPPRPSPPAYGHRGT